MSVPTDTTGTGLRDHPLLADALVGAAQDPPEIASVVSGRQLPGAADPVVRRSPATGAPLFAARELGEHEVGPAVRAARTAFDDGDWGRATGRDRARVLWRTAALLEQHADDVARLLVLEAGKPWREAQGEVATAVNAFEYFAGLARDIGGRTAADIAPDLLALTVRQPAGVAGIIVPWNFPLAILCQKLPPALAAGCTAVVKPSPLTPLSSLAMAALLRAAGLPPDALAVVLGDGAAGSAIVADPDVDVVTFTGSTATARRIAAGAGSVRLKRVALEAGGKAPVVVLDDADLDATVDGLLFASFFNGGQVCVAGSRVLVAPPVLDELTERLTRRAAAIRVGDPWHPDVELGPLVSDQHFATVSGVLREGVAAGATVVGGGGRAEPIGTAAGPFLQPTVVRADDDDNPLVREEVFGPVVVVQPAEDLRAALRRTNASRYGLGACVWTADVDRAIAAALDLRVGTVWINGSTDAFPELPLGGLRDSGYGAELGREGLEFFTALKTVQLRRGGPRRGWYGQ